MTKEEFALMINTEIEMLEQEQIGLRNQIEYATAIGYDAEDAKYKLELVSHKIGMIREFINYPAYARIQAMSDIEIEEYKKGKAEELDDKIQILKTQEEKEKANFSELLTKRKELMSNFGALQGAEREETIRKGRQIQQQIDKYEFDRQLGTTQKAIQELEQEKATLSSKTPNEIKNEMTQRLQNEDKKNYYNVEPKRLTEEQKLLAAVADDPEKSRQMANIMTRYGGLQRQQPTVNFQIPYYTTSGDRSYLTSRGIKTGDLDEININKALNAINEMEQEFNQRKEERKKTHSIENLSHLIGTHNTWGGRVPIEKIDLSYLQSQAANLDGNILGSLKRAIELKKQKSKKLFKSSQDKDRIRFLNDDITECANSLYNQLYEHYTGIDGILGITSHYYNYSFDSIANVQEFIADCNREIDMQQARITKIKASLQEAKENLDKQTKTRELEQQKCLESAMALAGIEYDKKELSVSSSVYDHNSAQIKVASYNAYHDDLIGRVQQEAQNQADTREAELTGVSIDELRQMRTEAVALQKQPTQDQNGERFAMSDTNEMTEMLEELPLVQQPSEYTGGVNK